MGWVFTEPIYTLAGVLLIVVSSFLIGLGVMFAWFLVRRKDGNDA